MARSPFLKELHDYMMVRNYSKRTIEAYLHWTKYFINFCGKQHPRELDADDIERFLTYLAVERQVSPGTQGVALNALIFLKTKYLQQTVEPLLNFRKAIAPRKLPTVLTPEEVHALLGRLDGALEIEH